MILASLHTNAGTIILDEPGLSFHPSKRSILRRYILNTLKNKTLIMVTHAPEMLEEDSLKYTYRCYRASGVTEAKCLLDGSIDQSLVSQSLEPQFKSLLFSENVLFVEGKTDGRFLELFYWMLDNVKQFQKQLEAYGCNIESIRKWNIIRLGGAAKSKNIIQLAMHFKIKWKLLLDGDMLYDKDRNAHPNTIKSDSLAASVLKVLIATV